MTETNKHTRTVTDAEMAEQRAYMEQIAAWNAVYAAEHGTARRYFVQTFGCQQNEADSERLAGMAEAMGYGTADSAEDADLILINMDAVHLVPCHDLESNLVYSAQGSDVCLNMVDGRILYENGEFKTLDQEKILYEARSAAARLLA